MKEKQKIVYYCDFCKKKGLVKHAMERHENRCFKNPDNLRPCFECNCLKKKKITYYVCYSDIHGETECTAEIFHCSKKEIYLKTPQNDFDKKFYEFDDQKENNYISMPRKCEEQEKITF